MSNANLGEPTPPVNDKSPELAEINNLFPGKYLTREETLEFLRAAIRMIEANSPPREVVSPPVVVPAVPAKKPPRRVTAVDHTDENTRALQAFVALEMQSGKFPTMSAVCKLSGIGRGVMYKADRLLQFKEIYDRKEKEYLARKNVTAVRDVRKGYRQDRESGGGLEAVDFDDDE